MNNNKSVNQYGLSRTIPEKLKREVRQKYGFGCIICGLGIYQYDHFEPEYKDAKEHSSDGIILLCPNHHNKKTTNFLSREKIAEYMANPAALSSGYANEILDIGKTYPELVFAGSIFKDCSIPISFSNIPLIEIKKPDIDGDPYSFNAAFFDSEGKNSLNIKDNEWMALNDNWDVETSGGVLTIREKIGKIHLILRNSSHNKIEIEKIESTIGGRTIRGDKDILQVFTGDNPKPSLTMSKCGAYSAHIGLII